VKHARILSRQVAADALERSGVDRDSIGLVIGVSCPGVILRASVEESCAHRHKFQHVISAPRQMLRELSMKPLIEQDHGAIRDHPARSLEICNLKFAI